MRIYDLARELNISNKDLVARLQAMGVAVKSHSSSIDEQTVRSIKQALSARPEPVAKPVEPQRTSEAPRSAAPSHIPAPPPAQRAAVSAPSPAVKKEPSPVPKPQPKTVVKAPEQPVPKDATVAAEPKPAPPMADKAAKKTIVFHGPIVVRELAERLGMKPNKLISELMVMSIFASINEKMEIKVAQQIAEKHGFILEYEKKQAEVKLPPRKAERAEETDRPEDLETRPPVVTFLGHIDHGKTSLLDRIRHASVAKGEAGGITQHIGAYTAEHNGRKITFLDTPGHAAFTAMRARGANVTDIAVIVVAADDGVMPQTEEAIKHVQAAKTAIMVAINKVDLPAANPEKVKRQLQSIGLVPEEWGGDVICVEVSALTGKNLDRLLEMILLQAEMLELKANPRARASGYVIEAQMEPGMGPTANLLVVRGTLSVGDVIICGQYWGRVKALVNDHGLKVRKVLPSTPVKCMGLSGVPTPGDMFEVMPAGENARELAEQRAVAIRGARMEAPKKVSLDTIFTQMAASQKLELRLILKCDTQGSLEAIQKMLGDIKSEKVSMSIVMASVGNVNENDVMLASASDAIIFGFNVGREAGVSRAEKAEGVEVRLYSIIYDIFDEIKKAMSGMLQPETREKYVGRAEVRQVFQISKKGQVAGCLVVDGRVNTRCKCRVKRGSSVLSEGSSFMLKRFQDQVNEVREGQECGIFVENFKDFEQGDVIEFFELEKIAQTL